MHPISSPFDRLDALRQRARVRVGAGLQGSAAPDSAARALTVLHGLASSPDTATDALALLHELQVHQVELEMQHEEMLQANAVLEAALARQRVLYDRAPMAYLTLDAGAVVRELNLPAARLLGAPHHALVGRSLLRWLSRADGARLMAAIQGLDGAANAQVELSLLPGDGPPRRMLACATADASEGQYLVTLTALDPESPPADAHLPNP